MVTEMIPVGVLEGGSRHSGKDSDTQNPYVCATLEIQEYNISQLRTVLADRGGVDGNSSVKLCRNSRRIRFHICVERLELQGFSIPQAAGRRHPLLLLLFEAFVVGAHHVRHTGVL